MPQLTHEEIYNLPAEAHNLPAPFSGEIKFNDLFDNARWVVINGTQHSQFFWGDHWSASNDYAWHTGTGYFGPHKPDWSKKRERILAMDSYKKTTLEMPLHVRCAVQLKVEKEKLRLLKKLTAEYESFPFFAEEKSRRSDILSYEYEKIKELEESIVWFEVRLKEENEKWEAEVSELLKLSEQEQLEKIETESRLEKELKQQENEANLKVAALENQLEINRDAAETAKNNAWHKCYSNRRLEQVAEEATKRRKENV